MAGSLLRAQRVACPFLCFRVQRVHRKLCVSAQGAKASTYHFFFRPPRRLRTSFYVRGFSTPSDERAQSAVADVLFALDLSSLYLPHLTASSFFSTHMLADNASHKLCFQRIQIIRKSAKLDTTSERMHRRSGIYIGFDDIPGPADTLHAHLICDRYFGLNASAL